MSLAKSYWLAETVTGGSEIMGGVGTGFGVGGEVLSPHTRSFFGTYHIGFV